MDHKDRHVAAAALALRRAASNDLEDEDDEDARYDVILLTENVKDMAKRQMSALGVRVLRPGGLLDEVYRADPEATGRVVMQAPNELKKPPYTIAELLDALRADGAATLAARMSKSLGASSLAAARRAVPPASHVWPTSTEPGPGRSNAAPSKN